MRLRQAGRLFVNLRVLISTIWVLTGLLACFTGPTFAQSGGSAALTPPDASSFPEVTFFLDAYDAAGNNISDLNASGLQILENGVNRTASKISQIQPGMQITLAYNVSPVMANRVSESSTFQKITSTLQTWIAAQPNGTMDDFTLITNDGVQTIRQTDPQKWLQELLAYQPDLAKARSGVSSLSQALDMATDPNPRLHMKRTLLYITALPADTSLSALLNLSERAAQMGVHTFIWLVAAPDAENSKGADALRQMAARTGGQFFLFTGAETLPDLEQYLKPLRSVYQVTYTSAINKSGSQKLAVKVVQNGLSLTTAEQTFSLDVQPPNPIFLDPPVQIHRIYSDEKSKTNSAAQPTSVNLKLLVEFPDGHSRALKSVSLFVDGSLAEKRTSPPFDHFDWDVSGYADSQRHTIQVKVEDVLGLTSASIEAPVEVLVDTSRQGWLKEQISTQRVIIGASILFAALALILVLWISGRKGWFSTSQRRQKARLMKDPVTQPVQIRQDQPRRPVSASKEQPSWPKPASINKAPAFLIRVDENNQAVAGSAIPIIRREITFGSNPQQASCVINAASVDGLHARLDSSLDGQYLLADAGSIAGTWVNFSPVSSSGTLLEHGDLVHFGQVAFRFELTNPTHIRQPEVTKYEDSL